ncbi:restriction endonuclease [Streptomyces sp. NPDC000987]|uniref:restriction endonuclease n=1 Tax=Streptomyces sp. NPDC000987 TaxID=3154374 RepID=UPI003321549A
MTTRTRRIRPGDRRRPFDLRATAVFFALLALLLTITGFAVRSAAGALRHRPVWVVLCLVVTATVMALHGRRRGFSAKRTAHRAAVALEEATHTALDMLDTPAIPTPAAQAAGHAPATGCAGVPAPRPGDDAAEAIAFQSGGAATVPVAGAEAPSDAAGTLEAPETVAHGAVLDYDGLGADEFEQAIAALCERDGCFEVDVVGGAGDLGADVLAVAPDGRRVVVQCKRYGAGNRVGSQDLQRFGGTCYTVHEADVAVVVTTSDFTAPAAEYAVRCGIVCVDGEALRAWSDGTGPTPWSAPAPEQPRH